MNAASNRSRVGAMRFSRASIILSLALGLMVLSGRARAQEFAQDQLIVVFAPKVGDDQKQTLHQERGHRSVRNLRGINGQLVQLAQWKSMAEAIAEYRHDPRVRIVEPNYIVHAMATPDDFYLGSLWGMQNTGQNIRGVVGTAGADIKATQAWSITTGSQDIVVGVVDTGVDFTHPDLAANIWSNPGDINGGPAGSHGYNAITKTFNPMDNHGHGTHVAGTIGALGNNSIGVAGVNWSVSIMPLKFLDNTGSGTVADAIAAIEFAVNAKKSGVNIRVLNNSWGGDGFSQALLDAIKLAGENDILFVASAGNSAANNDVANVYPASYDAPNVIAVAATDNNDHLATFSNYGANSVELAAPGVNIFSTYFNPATSSSGYAWLSGTSMAAPHVAGAAALVLANGYQSVSTLKNTLLRTVDPISSLATKTITGGRLNVYNALLALAVSVTPPSAVINLGESQVFTSTVSGGTPPYFYSWSNSSGPLGETGISISVGAVDTYSCTVTDSSVPPMTSTASATLRRADPIVTWGAPDDMVYGMPLDDVQLNASANVPGVFVYTPAAGTVLPAGSNRTLSVTFIPADASTYTSASASVKVNVNKAPLQIVANSIGKLYGAAVPALSASYIGFVNGDTSGSLSKHAILATTAKNTSAAGSYPITISGATAANYLITFVNGSLTVNPAPLTISAVAKTKNYGASVPALTAAYTGFVNGDSASKLTTQVALTTSATLSSPVGVYAITPGGATSPNYAITFVNGTLTINPAPLKITAVNKTKNYGQALPALTATYSGFVLGQTALNLETQAVLATGATVASPVGIYPITVSGATSPNYTITFVNGSLSVIRATLRISAQAKTTTYGAAVPALTISYSGFANGETAANLDTPAVIETSATQSSPVGPYPITVSGATAQNYTIQFVNGILTLKPASLSVRPVSKTKVYGAALPPLTFTVTGFVLGQTDAILTSPVSISTTATASSTVANYPITVSGAAAPNYTFAYSSATLQVTKAPLSVKASNLTKAFGAPVPPLTYTISGFVNGDTEANLDVPVSISTTATATSPVGNYYITPSAAVDANYTISFARGTLTITP